MKPVIFNSEDVQATLGGKKTQFRRVIKLKHFMQIEKPYKYDFRYRVKYDLWEEVTTERLIEKKCPYGIPGGKLWVRESLRVCSSGTIRGAPQWYAEYSADNKRSREFDYRTVHKPHPVGFYSALFMPKWASRITLEIKNVRVEKVHDIKHKDALAEGVKYDVSVNDGAPLPRFEKLWNSINAKKGYGWEMNPYVFVTEFEKCSS